MSEEIIFIEGSDDEEFPELLLFFNFLSKIDKLLFSEIILPIKNFGAEFSYKISDLVKKCTDQGYDSDFEEPVEETVEEMTRSEQKTEKVEEKVEEKTKFEKEVEIEIDLLETEEILFKVDDFEMVEKEKID